MTGGEIYAGTEAWRNWFELCAVKKCRTEDQKKLVRQITSSLTLALSRYGLKPADFEHEDLSDLFDIHFVLQGRKTDPKPLKSYYLARIDAKSDEQMKQLICGTFFSAKRGIVRDLARSIIPLVKGWTPHKLHGKIVWEAPLEKRFDDEGKEIEAHEPVVQPEPPADDPKAWNRDVVGIFKAVGGKRKTDAPLLVYSIANGIRPYNEVVWKHLGVKSVMANRKFHQALEAMASYMKKRKLTFEDIGFIKALVAASEKELGSKVIKELEGKA